MAPLRLGPVRVGALVDEVVADLVPTGRAVRFDVDVPESLEVQADPTRLRQLLTNVLDNAVRHSPEGGRVRVTCEVTRRPVAARRRRRGAGGRTRRPGARLRAVRHAGRPRRGRGHRRDRARPRHRALGGDPPQRHHPVRRPAARHVRRAAPRRPALEPARSSVRPDPPGGPDAHRRPSRPRPSAATAADLPRPPRLGDRRPRRSSTRCSAGSGPTCRAAAAPLVAGRGRGGRPGRAGAAEPLRGPGPVPRRRGGRAHGGVRRATQARPVHPDLPGPRGAVHAAGAAARRARGSGCSASLPAPLP